MVGSGRTHHALRTGKKIDGKFSRDLDAATCVWGVALKGVKVAFQKALRALICSPRTGLIRSVYQKFSLLSVQTGLLLAGLRFGHETFQNS